MLTQLMQGAGNRLLDFDPETRDRLAAVAGKVVCVELTGVPRPLYLKPHQTGMALTDVHSGAVDLTLRGSPFAFARYALAGEETGTTVSGVQIDGDAVLAQHFVKLLRQLDVDWEELLAQFLGDIGAHQFMRVAGGLRQWAEQVSGTLRMDLAEYLQEEVPILTPPGRVERLLNDIDVLRGDVARLEQRVARLRAGIR
jgi:ubiquinone biosynthesis protein UbiJ